jgi:hypothetical protein
VPVIPIGSTCVKIPLFVNPEARWRWNHVSFENDGMPKVGVRVLRIGDRLICCTLYKRKAQMRNKGFNIFNVFFTSLVVAESQLGNNMLVFWSRNNGLWARSEGDVIWNRLDPTETVRRTRTNKVSDMTISSWTSVDPFRKYLLIGGAIGGIVPQWTMIIINFTPVIVGSFVSGGAKERHEVVHVLHLLGSVELCANRSFCSPTIDVVEPHLFPSRGFVSNKLTTIHELI